MVEGVAANMVCHQAERVAEMKFKTPLIPAIRTAGEPAARTLPMRLEFEDETVRLQRGCEDRGSGKQNSLWSFFTHHKFPFYGFAAL